MINQIIEKIKSYSTIIIHRHSKPDGDAIGSQTGLRFLIEDNFPEKRVYTVGDAAGRFSFMEGAEPDVIEDGRYENALAIILDTSSAALISDERYKLAAQRVRIDHHLFIEKIAECELVDTSYESCAGLIADIAIKSGLKITERAAKALYTGIVTDSGRFRYDSTSANTHRVVSELRRLPFRTEEIYSSLYSDDLERLQLRAKFTLKINKTDAPVAFIYTDLEEAKSYGTDSFTISRGMVGVMGDIKGIDVWANFTETDAGVLAELRSSKYSIVSVAVAHGGGGHEKACGATLKDRAEAMALVEELKALVARSTDLNA